VTWTSVLRDIKGLSESPTCIGTKRAQIYLLFYSNCCTTQVRSQAGLFEICGAQSGKSTNSSPITTIPQTLHAHYCTHYATPHFLSDSYNSALGVRLNGGLLQNLVWDGFIGAAK